MNDNYEVKLPPVNYALDCPSLVDFNGESYFKRVKDFDYPENDNVVFLNGIGNIFSRGILFLSAAPSAEDVDSRYSSPMHLKSGAGDLFRSICLQNGIDIDNHYFTSVVKYAIKGLKSKLPVKDINYCKPLLEEELGICKPKVIVCIGANAAEIVLDLRVPISKLEEAWFYSEKFHAHVFVISSITSAYFNPEVYDKLCKEIEILANYYDLISRGLEIPKLACDYRCISTLEDLQSWIQYLENHNIKLFAVDCEWGDKNFVDGWLRSIQFSWEAGKAVYLNFHDENKEWAFDCSKEEVCAILQKFFNKKDVKYIGHNGAADAQWMDTHLGLDIYDGKFIFDTMFGMQVCDEFADLKLEKLAAKYTDKGRYDIDLILWKTKNKGVSFDEDEGYGRVPLSILFPYGCSDADVTFRLYPIIKKMLEDDDTYDYFMKVRLPFVTDGFASMSIAGIPFCQSDANEARLAYLAGTMVMESLFKDMIKKEAYDMFYTEVSKIKQDTPQANIALIQSTLEHGATYEEGFALLKKLYGKNALTIKEYYDHYFNIDSFNPNSPEDKRRWLFTIKKYVPIKTTKSDRGNPVPWERILKLPPAKQKEYLPAVDKDTLKIYADRGDDLCLHLLQMSAIEHVTKAFLKGEDGGIQKYVASDGKIHTNFVVTETGRPRSFKPNILNIPRYVTDYIKQGFSKVLSYLNIKLDKNGKVENEDYDKEEFDSIVKFLKSKYDIQETITVDKLVPKPLRWCFKAEDGCCFIDADYATAEVFAIAYLSNDKKLIATLTEPDPQFAFKRMPDGSEKQVRIAYIDDIVELSDAAKDPALLTDPNDPDLVRNPDGSLKHPKQDVHWAAVENIRMLDTPREKLNKDKTRDSMGKVANFCSGEENYIYSISKGGYVKANTIQVGDYLKSPFDATRVLNVVRLKDQECYKARFSNGVVATFKSDHKLRISLDGSASHYEKWEKVEDLSIGADVLSFSFNIPFGKKDVNVSHDVDYFVNETISNASNMSYRLPCELFVCDPTIRSEIIRKLFKDGEQSFESPNDDLLSDLAVLASTVGWSTTLEGDHKLSLTYLDHFFLGETVAIIKVVSKELIPSYDVIAIECDTHKYIDMTLLSHNSIPYGASPPLLERNIEVASGEKPKPGTGEKLIDAYRSTKVQVTEYLEWCKTLPETVGYYRGPSGYKRHFKVPPDIAQMPEKLRSSIVGKMQREACNVGLQNLVADSLARAVPPLNAMFRSLNKKSRAVIPLYDAIYIHAPYEEADLAIKCLKFFMSDNNAWNLKGGELKFSADAEVTKRWGTKPSPEEYKEVSDSLKKACQKTKI